MQILDIHTHILPAVPESALYSLQYGQEPPSGCFCSAGLHPWFLDENVTTGFGWLESVALNPSVLAIGEAGIDLLRGPSVEFQERVFTAQVELAERLRKPLIVHMVRSADRILRLRKYLLPDMPWLIHGFRGGAALASQLLDSGAQISFGGSYNIEAVRVVGLENLLIETDGQCNIYDVISTVAQSLEVSYDDVREAAIHNVSRFLGVPVARKEKEL